MAIFSQPIAPQLGGFEPQVQFAPYIPVAPQVEPQFVLWRPSACAGSSGCNCEGYSALACIEGTSVVLQAHKDLGFDKCVWCDNCLEGGFFSRLHVHDWPPKPKIKINWVTILFLVLQVGVLIWWAATLTSSINSLEDGARQLTTSQSSRGERLSDERTP